MSRQVRMGIDVGGTFTKAVAIDNATHEIIGKSSIKTTHDHATGVAEGVIQTFKNCLRENQIDPSEVVFVAHSTTQATNALIEGDVAKVGVLGIAKGGLEGYLAKRQLNIKNISLGEGKEIQIANEFLKMKDVNKSNVEEKLKAFKEQKAEVIVSSMAFGVDDIGPEELVANTAKEHNLPSTMAADITKLYGLTRRTRTAVINASILPKMLNTATSTENAVRQAGVTVPLMIMRGDGGVMEITEMKRRPVLTMLSGPAASVMGSLMYLRASNGIYFEVGGTTTNIGVIKNGRPTIDYSIVGGHATFISSLDVRITGVAGGSMVRANKSGIVDVGPRSAHIAGLDYAVFTDTDKLKEPHVEFFSPIAGDPADYVKVVMGDGSEVTITNTCAANVLGLITPDHFSYGQVESARIAIKTLADYCGTTVEDIATQIMESSFNKINPVIEALAEKYKLEKDQISLVGVGGGAASLIIYYSQKTKVKFDIPENAEVISSIGVALAMVRDVVERIIPSPSPEDIRAIKQEALDKAINSGASPETIEVHIEIDSQTSKVTAIATGSTEVKSMDLLKECSLEEAVDLAAEDMRIAPKEAVLLGQADSFFVFGDSEDTSKPTQVRILDKKGFIKVQRAHAQVLQGTTSNYREIAAQLWDSMSVYQSEIIVRPEFYVCFGARVMDFSASTFEQLMLLVDIELAGIDTEQDVILVAGNIKQT